MNFATRGSIRSNGREEILEFPGSVDGSWARYVSEADERGMIPLRCDQSSGLPWSYSR